MQNVRFWQIWLLLFALMLACQPAARAQEKFALLVGCTKYPYLDEQSWLKGPANDVLLMRELLKDEFGFPDDDQHIRILSDAQSDEALLPNRANIQQGFKWLAEKAAAVPSDGDGCQVVILLSGHGSRQADTSNDRQNDWEQDGFDEVFLPRDAKSIAPGSKEIPNAIVDDELRQWVADVREAGAFVWLVMDSCHSGTGLRGTKEDESEQVGREVKLMSDEEVNRISAEAAGENAGPWQPVSPFELPAGSGGVVAMYAALPSEKTFEMPLPPRGANRKRHGLLTYTLAQVIKQAEVPMSYEELIQRVRDQYRGWGRVYPTPLIEGTAKDQQVLGQERWPHRSSIRLTRTGQEMRVNVGRLQGVSRGSVLAIYPPPGARDEGQLQGYVEIQYAEYSRSTVKPCKFEDLEPVRELPDGGRAQVVFVDYGDMRMRVAVDTEGNPDAALVQRVRDDVDKMARAEDAVFQLTAQPADADWLVRVRDDEKVILVPAEGWSVAGVTEGIEKDPQRFGPVEANDQLDQWLNSALRRISKVRNLLKLTTESSKEKSRGWRRRGLEVELEARRLSGPGDWEGSKIEPDVNGLNFRDGDLVGIVVHNRSRSRIDVTLLIVDSAFGIFAGFPENKDTLDNRLEPNSSEMVFRSMVTSDTVGLEHVLLIAVKAQAEQPVNFIEFAQPSLQQAKGVVVNRDVTDPVIKGLRELLGNASFGQPIRRGVSALVFEECCMRLLSWNTLPADEEP